jgi:hypothetical protein
LLPLDEREIILRAHVAAPLETRPSVRPLNALRDSIARLVAGTSQNLEQESRG